MKKILSIVAAVAILATLCCGCATSGDKVKVIDIALSEEEYAFCVNKEDATLLTKVNEYLTQIKGDGTFDAICNNYFGDGTPKKVASATEDSSKDQLVVATSTGFEPFEMVESGKFFGIDMEIAKLIADELKMELVIEDMDFDNVVGSVGKQGIDIGMSGITITAERMDVINFSTPYYTESIVCVCKSDDTSLASCGTVVDILNVICKAG